MPEHDAYEDMAEWAAKGTYENAPIKEGPTEPGSDGQPLSDHQPPDTDEEAMNPAPAGPPKFGPTPGAPASAHKE